MNRLVLIGNGFDLAHDLQTSYKDFIYWYWEQRVEGLHNVAHTLSDDSLCELEITNGEIWSVFYFNNSRYLKKATGEELYKFLTNRRDTFRIAYTSFFENIHKAIETKRWVDIENEYYKLLTEYALREEDCEGEIDKLNEQLKFIQNKLIDYLSNIKISDSLYNPAIRNKIYAPFKHTDISIEGEKCLKKHFEDDISFKENLDYKLNEYGYCDSIQQAESFIEQYSQHGWISWDFIPQEFLLPNEIMLLNFNYTHTAHLYCMAGSMFTINQIHGDVEDPNSIIFGYGDELDEDYKKISNLNDNKLLANIKSIKYLEADKYRKILAFIESEPYQVLIMGHSCGNSDRTLLNKIFEHKNCVSIKPYYYIKENGGDSYLEMVQNIHRNFTDMNIMRDRVVNKLYCETLT